MSKLGPRGIAAIGGALMFSAHPVLASGGGGGGGGGSLPSASTPQYNPAVEYRKAIQALDSRNFKDADKALTHVLDVAPNEPNSLFAMGLAKTGENDLKGAARYFDKVVRVSPGHPGARRELALTEIKLGQSDKAGVELGNLKGDAAKCADVCPQAAALKTDIAQVEAAMAPPATKPTAALAPSGLIFASTAEGDNSYLDAVRLINLHRYEAALDKLNTARHAFGPHPDVLTYLGYVNRKLGRLDQAELYYNQVLAIAPGHVGATEYYGELKVERGDIAGAKRLLAKLETECVYGCVEENELRRWINAGHEPR